MELWAERMINKQERASASLVNFIYWEMDLDTECWTECLNGDFFKGENR